MITLSENNNNDLYLDSSGNIAMCGDLLALLQLCKSRMEVVRGELIYNQTGGMPYNETAWDAYIPKAFEAAGRAILKATSPDEITGVTSFTVSMSNNTLSYIAEITTIYGTGTITS